MSDIPKPTDTGSAGTQQPGTITALVAEPSRPLEGLPIAQRLEGLAAARPRSMGGEIAASLVAGSFTQLSNDLNETRRDLQGTQQELRSSQDALAECQVKAAVLDEKVKANSRERHLRNLSIAIGTALIGFAIELTRHNLDAVGYVLGGVGVLLLLFGWFSVPKEAKT